MSLGGIPGFWLGTRGPMRGLFAAGLLTAGIARATVADSLSSEGLGDSTTSTLGAIRGLRTAGLSPYTSLATSAVHWELARTRQA